MLRAKKESQSYIIIDESASPLHATCFQGKIHLNVNFERNRNDETYGGGERLHVQVFEACDLTRVNANCDPFVEVTIKYTNGKQETQRTKVKKKDNCPVFDEDFLFTVNNHRSSIAGDDVWLCASTSTDTDVYDFRVLVAAGER